MRTSHTWSRGCTRPRGRLGALKGQLTLEEHGGRTLAGVYARVAARLLALAAAIWHNWHNGAPVKRSLIAYDS